MVNDSVATTRRTALQYAGCASFGGMVALTGCTGKKSNSNQGNDDEMRQITALGGVTGGSGYQQCLAFQQIVHENLDSIRVSVSGTSGWKTDAKLMWSQGNAEFGIVPAGDAFNILHGKEPYAEKHHYTLQAYPAVPPTYLHAVAPRKSNIENYSDLGGKKVNVLPRGALSATLMPKVMKALGYKPQKYFHYPHQQAANALKEGNVDAVVGAGVAAPYQEVSQQLPLRVVSLKNSEKKPINEKIPWLGFSTVDFGQYYKGAGKSTIPAPWTVMGCLDSLEKDFVYNVVKTIFNNVDMAAKIYDPAKQLKPKLAPQTKVPVHPGAYKFFQEKGIDFPAELRPPKNLPLK